MIRAENELREGKRGFCNHRPLLYSIPGTQGHRAEQQAGKLGVCSVDRAPDSVVTTAGKMLRGAERQA